MAASTRCLLSLYQTINLFVVVYLLLTPVCLFVLIVFIVFAVNTCLFSCHCYSEGLT